LGSASGDGRDLGKTRLSSRIYPTAQIIGRAARSPTPTKKLSRACFSPPVRWSYLRPLGPRTLGLFCSRNANQIFSGHALIAHAFLPSSSEQRESRRDHLPQTDQPWPRRNAGASFLPDARGTSARAYIPLMFAFWGRADIGRHRPFGFKRRQMAQGAGGRNFAASEIPTCLFLTTQPIQKNSMDGGRKKAAAGEQACESWIYGCIGSAAHHVDPEIGM
jgi:hypothetical protein